MTADTASPSTSGASQADSAAIAHSSWRTRWSDRPLAVRIGALLAFAASLSAAVATAATLAIAWWSAEQNAREEAVTLARAIGYALQAPVSFMDDRGIRDAMEVLRVQPNIQGAWVHDVHGGLLYASGALEASPPGPNEGGLTTGWMKVSEVITASQGGERLGHLVMQVSLDDHLGNLRFQALAAAASALLALAAGLLASHRLARRISQPVVQLAEAASTIAREQRYDLRLPEAAHDEVGVAVRAFNQMIGEVQRRDEALGQLNTSLQQQALDAQAARAQAESASLAKTRFLANMSHELRSPLNGVIGAAQLLQLQGANADRRQELVEIIRTSGSNLLGLIESVLDLARIEAGALQAQTEDFNLPEQIDAAVLSCSAAAATKGLRLVSSIEPAVAAWRRGDGARVRQLLLNLLGNAIKFTTEGEVRLSVRSGAVTGEIAFEVCDTGIGIAADALAHIFEPFQQADVSTTRRFGGSGLGLTICHELALHMGGRIDVHSQPGAGSCFTLVLPLPPCPDAAPAPLPLGLRVAWCEPHPSEAGALEALLRRLGCESSRCDTPQALREFMSSPDRHGRLPWLLVATDEPRGRALLQACSGWLDPARVIAIANGTGAEARQPAGVHGLGRPLARPVLRAALISRLGSALGLSGRQNAPASSPQRAEADPGAACNHVLVVEDDPINQAVVCSMLEHAGWHCSVAGDGHAALTLLREKAFDLVLMDWQMPEMDGLETTRRLRAGAAGPAARALPVVALTANAFAEDRAVCMAAGMNDFLTKPVLAANLVSTVQRWLRPGQPLDTRDAADAAEATEALDGPPATSAPAGADSAAGTEASDMQRTGPADYDPAVLAALPMVADGSDPGFADELLAQFDASCVALLATVERSLDADDAATLLRSVHTLKSSAAQVGARALSAEAARQEAALRQGAGPAAADPARLAARMAAFRRAAGLVTAAD